MKKRIVGALAGVWILVASVASGQLITPERIEELQVLKTSIYPGLTRTHAEGVATGDAQPIVYTEVGGGDLPVSYYHYRVPKNRVNPLAAAIPLPPGFTITPISIVKHTRPRHYISLTVYEVAGERSGLRAEWTTYVLKDGDPKPRVMMLETQTSEGSLDPIDLFSDPADVFEYSRAGGTLITEIVSGSSSFSASLWIPRNRRARSLDPGWNSASDVLYWSNGVADLQNVNGLVSNRRLAWLQRHRVSIDNRTRWAAFVERRPRWVLLFDERIDTAIRPWVNVTDPSLPLDPDFRDQLIETKATVFSENEFQRADAIAARMAEPMENFFVEETPPSIFLNFRIEPEQLDALAAAIPLPEGFELARVRPLKAGAKSYFLSLNIYEVQGLQGLLSGFRAEWDLYVTKPGDPVPRYMIVDAQSTSPSLDPVNGFTEAADVFEYSLEDGVISVNVQEPGTSFQATIPLPEKPRRRATTLDWTEANNLIYWGNGVADKIYYSGLVYDTKVIKVPKRTVSISNDTVWAPYLQRLDQVIVFENRLDFIASPWNNLNQLEEEAAAP
jgi:hypothetical protein